MRPCTDEVEVWELIGAIVWAEPGGLHERRPEGEGRPFVTVERIAEVERVNAVFGDDIGL